MKLRKIGNSDLEVSEVGFGLWTLAANWWGEVENKQEMLQTALDCGINFFDTAPVYGDEGLGETLMAPILKSNREEIILTTKCGYDISEPRPAKHSERPHNWTSSSLTEQLEQSLKRLETDYIDLYQLHNVKIDAVLNDEVWETLEGFVTSGKVKYLGIALGPAIGWVEEGLKGLDLRNIVSLQTVFNILEQEPGLTFANHENVQNNNCSLISRVPHASDVLSGKASRDSVFRGDDHRKYRAKANMLDNFDKADNIARLWGKETGRTIGSASVAGILANNKFACVLPTCVTVEEIKEYAQASEQPFSQDEADFLMDMWKNNFGVTNRYEMELRESK
jgi:aryl-alcohol dehydrogenase-like predicted oxidoreductase